MMIFNIQVEDELGEAILKDAEEANVPVNQYILNGMWGGIFDGYTGANCLKYLDQTIAKVP